MCIRDSLVRMIKDFNLTVEAPLRLPLNETHSLALYSWNSGGGVEVMQLDSDPGKVLVVVRGPGWLKVAYELLSSETLTLYIKVDGRTMLTRALFSPYEAPVYLANVSFRGEWIVWRGPEGYGRAVYVVLPENWYKIRVHLKGFTVDRPSWTFGGKTYQPFPHHRP